MNSDHMKLHRVKGTYLLLISAGLGLLVILDIISGQGQQALMTLACAVVLVVYALLMPLRGRRPPGVWPLLTALPLTAGAGFYGAISADLSVIWSFLFCGLAVFLLSFRQACLLIPLYSLVWLIAVLGNFPAMAAAPVIFTYSICAVLALSYAWVNETNLRNLSAVANTDPVTMVYNQYQFTLDLGREMTRAERLMDELYLVGVRPPQIWNDLGADDYERRLNYLAGQLRSCLKKTDTCYRLDSDDFVLLTPHSSAEETDVFMTKVSEVLAHSEYSELQRLKMCRTSHVPGEEVDAMVQKIGESLNAV